MSRRVVVDRLKRNAETGLYSGLIRSPADRQYLNICRYADLKRGVILVFTRDSGHHSGGWFKNPDYERCYHLSVSFFDQETLCQETLCPVPFKKKRAEKWVKDFFGGNARLTWCEPPYTEEGKGRGVHHYRLFYDPSWKNPIKPRKEVYSKDFTEKGWKSFSEIHGNKASGVSFGMGSPG